MTVTASVFPAWGNPMQMPCSLALIVLTARASVSPLCARDRFLFRERPRPSRPPVFFLPGTCEEKTAGRGSQRLVESELTPAQIPRASLSPNREVSPVLFSQPDQRPSASVSDLVLFGGSDDELADDSMSLVVFRCWGAVGLSDWPRPLRFARAQRRQSRDGCRTFPCPLKSGWRAGFGVVSTRGALSQPSGWVVSAGAPSGPSATTIAVLPWSSRRAHEILVSSKIVPICVFIKTQYELEYRQGTYSVTVVTSVPWDMERALRTLPCQVAARLSRRFSRSNLRILWRNDRLYSQIPAHLAGSGGIWREYIDIGSCSSAADSLVRFLPLHEPIVVQFHCVIEIDFSSGEKGFFPYASLSRRSTRSVSQGTEVRQNRVRYSFFTVTGF